MSEHDYQIPNHKNSTQFSKVTKKDVSKVFSLDLPNMQKYSSALTTRRTTKFQLEVEDEVPSTMTDVVQAGMFVSTPIDHDSDTRSAAREGMVFFRPVDGNLSHHTFIGESFQSNFDFLAQVHSILHVEKHPNGYVKQVVLGAVTGEPKIMNLSKMNYGDLSTKLRVWNAGESNYDVVQQMSFGQQSI